MILRVENKKNIFSIILQKYLQDIYKPWKSLKRKLFSAPDSRKAKASIEQQKISRKAKASIEQQKILQRQKNIFMEENDAQSKMITKLTAPPGAGRPNFL